MASFSRLLSTISKKVVKPFSPTPPTQRIHKLSLVDQCMGNFYMPYVLFYPKNQIQQGPKQLSKLLENSLSKTMIYHQSWAGSLRDNATIHCDDAGTEFFEVEVNCPMNQIVHCPDLTFPQGLLWRNIPPADVGGRLSVAQLSRFDCGGIAISMCLSHKDSLMPSLPDAPLDFPFVVEPNAQESVNFKKRLFLSESKIRALKALVAFDPSSVVQNPTTTEVVSALIYKCAAVAGANLSSGNDSLSQMVLLADLRKTIPPPIPSTSAIGNIITSFSTPIYSSGDLRLPKLVADIRKSKHELSTRDNFKENALVSEMLKYTNKINTGVLEDDQYSTSSHDVYRCSSVCNMPFQELDFGWGRPSRATVAIPPFSNMIYLMNTHGRSRGIEVYVNFNQQLMSIFEQDRDLLQFATPVQDHVQEEKCCI